ncbi:hypothetical protein LZQ00_02960 [Sphingobacterium sp. SRCM116780]|uniref:hypothetical protein n=1 Tax=Sphingobacterium sp. SRCM116780 TaxID=2907623 RepID=UPI001F24820B|nr:hypothetical protein [Sphingobacterium sp. SRCM116780]UIR56784.1 hypothetical protein LZQ00_02960 [Sphingobacterium sp. SRCM116780]
MKKIIALSLSLITIVICGWLIIKQLHLLDIPPNKNDTYAMWEKQEIDARTDIDTCEKKVLKNQIDLKRKNERYISDIVFENQRITLAVVIIQLILLVFIFLLSNGKKKQ